MQQFPVGGWSCLALKGAHKVVAGRTVMVGVPGTVGAVQAAGAGPEATRKEGIFQII